MMLERENLQPREDVPARRRDAPTPATGTSRDAASRAVSVPAGTVTLAGDLTIPTDAEAIVLFAHGSGSSRHSPRNRRVARTLQDAALATLLMDLLTVDEERVDERTRQLRFDIELLATRLVAAIDWLGQQPDTGSLPIGCFGASTGAAAALRAAAQRAGRVMAVVSRGGRPDLAGDVLEHVQAPTLLIVGGRDVEVMALNEDARARMRAPAELRIVPGATHLFEEPGALDVVSTMARDWFVRHLRT
ncbi:MAG TPA: alpha/beta family hydrolase [Gemmatimonadaceae bacterium]|nr:alpha/beta family hydrolase [Gemmatimonadaceae bacterium]